MKELAYIAIEYTCLIAIFWIGSRGYHGDLLLWFLMTVSVITFGIIRHIQGKNRERDRP